MTKRGREFSENLIMNSKLAIHAALTNGPVRERTSLINSIMTHEAGTASTVTRNIPCAPSVLKSVDKSSTFFQNSKFKEKDDDGRIRNENILNRSSATYESKGRYATALLRHFLLNRCRKRKSNWTDSFFVISFVSHRSHWLGVGSIHHPTDKGDISL